MKAGPDEFSKQICSLCGSKHYEFFRRSFYSGIRCISCGHEAVTEDRRVPEARSQNSWTSSDTKATF